MPPSTPTHISSTAFQIRLNLLESLLSGSPSSSTLSPDNDARNELPESKDLQSRTITLEEDFQSLIGGGNTGLVGVEHIRRFVDRFESIQTLLKSLPPSPPTSTSTTPNPPEPIPSTSKLPHILSIHPDLIQTTHLLTQLQILTDQDVSGSGSLVHGYALDQAQTTRSRLSEVQRTLGDRGRGGLGKEKEGEGEGEQLRVTQGENLRRMVGLLTRWDEFTKQSSQIFLNLHETMTDLERAVERVERGRGLV